MTLLLVIVAVVAAAMAVTFDFGEAFGVASPLAIVVPAKGGGAPVAIACGMLGIDIPRSIQCSPISALGYAGKAFDIYPNVTFVSVSSGRDTMCGLQSGGTSFFCWKHARNSNSSGITSHILLNAYQTHVVALGDLAVGEDQVSAADKDGTFIGWWNSDPSYPWSIPGRFRSLTSGRGFFCAINDEDKVVCWGSKAQNIYPAFEDEEMSAIVSGEYHACGITKKGRVICGGNNDHGQCSPPESSDPFEFISLALGSTHTCAVRSKKQNNDVVCWGAGVGVYSPTGTDAPFLSVAANGNLTCGVRLESLKVFCWWTSRRGVPAKVFQLPLSRQVVYGICVPESSCGPCDYYTGSGVYCADKNVICRPCP